MTHKLQLVRVLPFAEAGTVFSCIFLHGGVFHGFAHGECAAFGVRRKTSAGRHSNLAAAAARLYLPRKTNSDFYC
jgi:hypothetical protein